MDKVNGFLEGFKNGLKPFSFLLTLIQPKGRIFCSPEQSKLCFEQRKTFSAAQNHLSATAEAETRSEVAGFEILEINVIG